MKPKSCKLGNFTLIEILAAMAVFLVLSVVMMRLFNSAQRIYNTVTQRNIIYADARVALDIITRDLHCALFNNDLTTEAGIYPFWFRHCETITNDYYPAGIGHHELNFIAATDMRAENATSSICEIRYTFVPAGRVFIANSSSSPGRISEGWLIRSSTGNNLPERYNFGDNSRKKAIAAGDSYRLNKIWVDTTGSAPVINNTFPVQNPNDPTDPPLNTPSNPSYDNFQRVIPHVYNLKFTCFSYYPGDEPYDNSITYNAGDWVTSGTAHYMSLKDANLNYPPLSNATWWRQVNAYNPATNYSVGNLVSDSNVIYICVQNGTGKTPASNPDYWQPHLCKVSAMSNSNTTGSPFPITVKVELQIFAPSDWREWKNHVDSGNAYHAEKIKRERLRTFSKTIFLGNRESFW